METKTLDAQKVEGLRSTTRGKVLCPGNEGYDEARKVWNGMIDKRPALILQCAGVSDVIEAVKFVHKQDIPLAVRGGGHSLPGHSVCDDGLIQSSAISVKELHSKYHPMLELVRELLGFIPIVTRFWKYGRWDSEATTS